MCALINYEDVPDKLWALLELTYFWGIGEQIKKNLAKLDIHSIDALTHANSDLLKKKWA